MATQLREAASIILVRGCAPRGEHAYELLLLRRGRGAAFMASAHVFPGGAVDAGETLRDAATRELHEEAAVVVDPSSLAPWAHWITPSVEPRRFSAHFFVAECRADQAVTINPAEMVGSAWVTPTEGLTRSTGLALPPPQIRTLWELRSCRSIADVNAVASVRAAAPAPILPRALREGASLTLLLPWDADYATRGDGAIVALPSPAPAWARGPSRFTLVDGSWRY